MKCPYCFKLTRIRPQKKKGSRLVNYCLYCKSEVPKTYLESLNLSYTKIGMVGYSGHGKTTYINSLLYLIDALNIYWNNFYFETLDDTSHAAMYYSVPKLQQGRMPTTTKAVFPRPIFIKFNNLPGINSQFVSFFDTGGMLFENLDLMTKKGRYLSHSNVIFFFISLTEKDMEDNWNIKITKLLDRYINVVYSRYGTKTAKKQNIAFIITKSDELVKHNDQYQLPSEIISYYNDCALENYKEFNKSVFDTIKQNSSIIEAWLRSNNCNSFINFAKNHFRDVSFMLTSALGTAPVDGKLDKELTLQAPKCVLDPFLWALNTM